MTLAAGSHLGQYEILAKLGAGGMGEVYRARDPQLDREVAIKVLPEHLAKDRNVLGRFEREAKALASLSHANILTIHHIGIDQEVSYLVMELLDGETLRARISRSSLPWRQALEIGAAVANGLSAAHSKGVVHRDLKPENIFLTSDGGVKILDFGLAKVEKQPPTEITSAPTASTFTQPGMVMGTVQYMSPEQARGLPADARSDIFSFGCVLYEMVTGNRPFSRETAAETLTAIMKEDPPPVDESGKVIPVALNDVVSHCLEKKPEDRFQSARDLLFNMQRITGSGGVSNSRAATIRGGLRHPRGMWIAIAALVVLALIVALQWTGLGDRILSKTGEAKIESLAILPMDNLSGDPQQEYFAEGMTEALITELSKIGSLRVISRQSVMRYKGSDKPLPDIGKELGVDAIVEGSVLLIDDQVRINAQLIEARRDRHLWAKTYDRNLNNILALHSELARAIADEIEIALTSEEESRLQVVTSVNPEAYEAYLMGRHNLRKMQGEEGKAIEYFERACEIDTDFALGYAGLAEAYAWLGAWHTIPPEDAWPKARIAAEKALKLDQRLSEAHTILAWARFQYDFDWLGAESEFQLALDLSPNNADARHIYSWLLMAMEQYDKAISQLKIARKLDPLSLSIQHNLGNVLTAAKHYDEAHQVLGSLIDLNPEYAPGYYFLAWLYASQGKYVESIGPLQTAIDLMGDNYPEPISLLGYVYGRLGKEAEARRTLEQLDEFSERGIYVSPVSRSYIYIGLGKKDRAFELLEEGYRKHESWLPYIRIDFFFNSLRDDPRFQDLLRRMNFPE